MHALARISEELNIQGTFAGAQLNSNVAPAAQIRRQMLPLAKILLVEL
jgi:hypothetical protein